MNYRELSINFRFLIILGMALVLGGCRARTVYVEAPTVHVVRDTLRERALRVDSIMVRDSVHVSGPEVYRERLVYRTRRVTDTVYVARTDTVMVTRVVSTHQPTEGGAPWWKGALIGAALCIGCMLGTKIKGKVGV